MSDTREKLADTAIEESVTTAKNQSWVLIERMLRKTIKDWDSCDSENFKLTITIDGERKRGGTFTIQTRGQSTVELKMKDQTEASIIDYGPTLFDPPATGTRDIGSEADMPGEVIDMEEVGKPVRLLPGGRKAIRGRKAKALPAHTDAADKEEGGAL